MGTESVRFVVHESEPWGDPRREFDRLEDALAWHREMCPSWEVTKVTHAIFPRLGDGVTSPAAPTMEALGELLHHHYGETLAAEGDSDPGAVWRLVGDLVGELDELGMLPPGPAGFGLEPGYTAPDTSAPLTIRTVADINANQGRIEGLAMRAAHAIGQGLEDYGSPATFAAADVVDLFRHTIAAVLIDQPGRGEAVDIAGEQFGSALRAYLREVA